MLISELEEKLKALRKEHGDLRVFKKYEVDTFRQHNIEMIRTVEYDPICEEWYYTPESNKPEGVVIC